jgi:hypothetical protein
VARALLAAAVAVLALAAPAHAQGSCADAAVVDGRLLMGTQIDHPDRLPPSGGPYRAVLPRCGEVPDRPLLLVRLRGVPPAVAVVDRARETLYRDENTLVALAVHPLHGVITDPGPSLRADGGCRAFPTPVAGFARSNTGAGLTIAAGARRVRVRLDPTTVIAGAPAYTPIRPGQKLRIDSSRCGRSRVADRIAVTGPVPPGERYAGDPVTDRLGTGGDASDTITYVVPAVILGVALLLIVVVGVALLGPRRRPRAPR